MNTNFRIIKYMEPVPREGVQCFRTIVSPQPGYYVLISEVHRRGMDEALCFPCDSEGEPTRLIEITSGWDTPSALENLKGCWTPERHRGEAW